VVATVKYSDAWSSYAYAQEHPLKPIRPQLTCELVQAYALLTGDHCCAIPAPAATLDEFARFHKAQYLNVLQAASLGQVHVPISQYGLGPGDNPAFPGIFRCSSLIAGASLQAAQLMDAGAAQAAFNITGGLHHGMPSRASGFSYVNDVILAIDALLDRGRRMAYIDIDTHHGDGLQAAYYHRNQVLTISLHGSGKYLFPGRGFDPEIGYHFQLAPGAAKKRKTVQ
jgi:acetoin utilization protein AcuC